MRRSRRHEKACQLGVHHLSTAAFFTFFAVFAVTQVVFVARLWYLQTRM